MAFNWKHYFKHKVAPFIVPTIILQYLWWNGPPSYFLNAMKTVENGTTLIETDKGSALEKFVFKSLTKKVTNTDEEMRIRSMQEVAAQNDVFLEKLKACRKNPLKFPARYQNAVQFIDLVSEYQDENIQMAFINAYGNLAIIYDNEKSDHVEAYKKTHKHWGQAAHETMDKGTGICLDYALLKSALILAIKGEAWHKNNTSLLAFFVSQNLSCSMPYNDKNATSHIVTTAQTKEGRLYLGNMGALDTNMINAMKLENTQLSWGMLFMAACETGDIERDRFSHSTTNNNRATNNQLRHEVFPNKTATIFYNLRLPSITNFYADPVFVISRKENIIYCAEPKFEMYDATTKLIEKAAGTKAEKKRFTQIINLCMESNDYYRSLMQETPQKPTKSNRRKHRVIRNG